MRALILTSLLGLGACSSQPTLLPDYFAAEQGSSAARARETTLIESDSLEEACAQVVAVLMDMDCRFQEVDSELGVVSAYSAVHEVLHNVHRAPLLPDKRSCAGVRVTVSVNEAGPGRVAVRATFRPKDARADETFRTLLRKSVSLQAAGRAQGG